MTTTAAPTATTHAMKPTLLAIGSAFPPHELSQQEAYEGLFKRWYETVPNAEQIMAQTRVQRRRMAWDPRVALASGSPGTGDRLRVFEEVMVDVAGQSATSVLEQVERGRIGSFVMASCTGYLGPTPDLLLARRLGLRSDLRRTFIGHMGCFAAFNVLKVAMDSLAARPDELVLANCTESSSIHFRPDATAEQAVIHALFGDASASLVLGSAPEGSGVQLLRTHTEQLYDTYEMMTWTVKNDGFFMTLSPYVPFVLVEHIEAFLAKLLGPSGLAVRDIRHWGIHPGGPKIVEFISKKLALTDAQVRATWHVLSQYGNCSSSTVLLVLEDILAQDRPQRGEYGVLMAFGPGLTMEGLLVRF